MDLLLDPRLSPPLWLLPPAGRNAPLELPTLLLSLLLPLLGIVNLSLRLRRLRLKLPNPSLCLLGTPATRRGGKGTRSLPNSHTPVGAPPPDAGGRGKRLSSHSQSISHTPEGDTAS